MKLSSSCRIGWLVNRGMKVGFRLAGGLLVEIGVEEAGLCFGLELPHSTCLKGTQGGPPIFKGVAGLCSVELF